ncbi:DUF2085 domain-containing protein [Leptolyngbya sp. ST-U4]|uniref:DUF2085 domain-containing protein n=1 Tax=Leptolyngbya sp. ST-U4 TaxID=2933912 RepID=UPI00199C2633|nr:DUF2085 domain-containing protein [Cyanobacteria bacterium FACHB-502]
MEIASRKPRSSRNWAGGTADFLLAGMVVGPLMAPFLAGSGLLGVPIVANIIYFMGRHVCPQPELGLALSPPWMMAVCMRCYGTVLGLFVTRLLYGMTKGRGFYWLHQYGWGGAIFASGLMMAYGFEYGAQMFAGWQVNQGVMTLFGLITGVGWGLLAMPILHGLRKVAAPAQ